MNAKEAYLAIDTNCKVTSANRIGYQVLRRPQVREYIESRLEPIILSTNRVLANISHLAENAELERDRLKALEMIGKFHKLFTERLEHTGADGQPIQVSTIIIQGVKPDDSKSDK